jgi:hypothetical protein
LRKLSTRTIEHFVENTGNFENYQKWGILVGKYYEGVSNNGIFSLKLG